MAKDMYWRIGMLRRKPSASLSCSLCLDQHKQYAPTSRSISQLASFCQPYSVCICAIKYIHRSESGQNILSMSAAAAFAASSSSSTSHATAAFRHTRCCHISCSRSRARQVTRIYSSTVDAPGSQTDAVAAAAATTAVLLDWMRDQGCVVQVVPSSVPLCFHKCSLMIHVTSSIMSVPMKQLGSVAVCCNWCFLCRCSNHTRQLCMYIHTYTLSTCSQKNSTMAVVLSWSTGRLCLLFPGAHMSSTLMKSCILTGFGGASYRRFLAVAVFVPVCCRVLSWSMVRALGARCLESSRHPRWVTICPPGRGGGGVWGLYGDGGIGIWGFVVGGGVQGAQGLKGG